MSTLEDRRHDADLDARTACPDCAADGFASSLADCPGHDPELLPSPETLDYIEAARWARACQVVANGIRHELAYATAARIAEQLERHAAEYRERRDDLIRGQRMFTRTDRENVIEINREGTA